MKANKSEPRDLIQEHYRHPRNQGRVPVPTLTHRGRNPLCGDEVELSLTIGPEGGPASISAIAFTARACSVVQASASMLTELVKGRSVVEAEAIVSEVVRTLTTSGAPGVDPGPELAALANLRLYPARVKCARLPWDTLDAALATHAGRGLTA